MKRFHLSLLFLLLICSTQAQRFTSFSSSPESTVAEMKALFATAPDERKKESEALLIRFETFWNNPSQTKEMTDNFIEISNKMLAKKMRPYPHFKAFMEASFAFLESEMTDQANEWKQMVLYHVANDVNSFHHKMEGYLHFYSEDLLSKEANASWKVYGTAEKIGVKEEPFIQFVDVDLVGRSKQDSLTVVKTTGYYHPSTGKWIGKGGTILWDRAGLGESAKAELSDYTVDVRYAKITAENALLHYPKLFPNPIKGVVDDKATVEVSEEKATYPRFKSYDNYIVIPEIYKEVDYIGGFEMRGASIMGSSDGVNLARILIKKDNKVVISAMSTSFLFRPENVLSNDARVAVYIEEDSIYHPAANFKYAEKSREFMMSRPQNGVGRTPFIDTYHKMDITTEAVVWKVSDETIEFRPIVAETGGSVGIFESQNYFESAVMRKIQGYNDVSPLYTLWELYKQVNYQPVPLDLVISHFKRSPADIKQLLIDLAAQGFVEYDIHNDKIHYRSKIAQYLNNDVGRKDYDNIRLESKNQFASLDLLTNDLRVTGCEFFILSDAQIVNVYPAGEKVTVKKNRDMTFSGRVIGGLFDFVTHNCKFEYDRFLVEMDVIDSLLMYTEDKNGPVNMYGEHKLRKVENPIEELAGTLYIDVPQNKSGREDYPDYPIFESRKNGKVFYDHKFNNNGAYTRDRFYFSVAPFRIVQLDDFEPDSMRFNGYLNSGGIFPDIHEELIPRSDFSLGFAHNTGAAGLPMYGGKGHYSNLIDLSNKGLRGKGDIKYCTSITKSDSIFFFLDSLNAKVNQHDVAPQLAGTEYPEAHLTGGYLHWEPYLDQMFVHTRQTPMTIFDEIELTGFSKLTPSGMYGGGLSKFKRADLTSNLFWFKHHELLADTANLRIYALTESEFALTTDNYNSHIDFKTRKGVFISNGIASEILFVKNEFRANASRFDWDPIDENILRFRWMDDPHKDVDINNTPSRDLVDMISKGNELIATHPEKNGLQFNALNAEFDFGKNIIKADGVRFINIGDAALIPHNGEVTIYEKGDIASFNQSRLLAGRANKYHEVYNVSAKINSRTKFIASGDYDYIDENELTQTLHFDTIWFFNTTQGFAKIPLAMDFKFSPHFAFDGRAELHSDQPSLYYVGGVEFVNDCDTIKPTRLRILQHVDPKNILIEIHNRSRDVNDRKAVVAIASSKSGRIYTAFGAAKEEFNDSEYISVFGFIMYDKEANCFRAASLEKLQDHNLPGNMITFDVYDCVATGRGEINMSVHMGRMDFKTNGAVVNYMRQDSANMHLTTSIDFFFSDKSMKVLSSALEANTNYGFVSTQDDIDYELALLNIMGEETYNKYKKDGAVSGRVNRLPKELQVRFFFSNIDFVWDPATSAFISQRSLPLIICGSTQIYKMVPGRIVIERRGSRDRLYIYLENNNDYFIFQCENNSISGYSSVKDFNDEISKIKAKDRVIQSEKGMPSFTYKLGNRSQQRTFIKKYYPAVEDEETTE